MSTNTIYKGSAPTIVLNVKVDLTDWNCLLTIDSGCSNPFVKKADSIEFDGERTKLSFWLSQAETFQLKKGAHQIQLRAVKGDDAIASNLVEIRVVDPLLKRVIDDGTSN